jgi:biotin carboxyl carrier protein
MEHTVRANAAAVIEEILVAAGDQVDDGAALLVLAEPSDESG